MVLDRDRELELSDARLARNERGAKALSLSGTGGVRLTKSRNGGAGGAIATLAQVTQCYFRPVDDLKHNRVLTVKSSRPIRGRIDSLKC